MKNAQPAMPSKAFILTALIAIFSAFILWDETGRAGQFSVTQECRASAIQANSAATIPGEPALTARERQLALQELKQKALLMPLAGIDAKVMSGSFYELRGGQLHGAVDLLAPRNTPVRAVERGVIAKLFTSRLGGLTIYQFDPTKKYIYYYAHLEKYASGINDGDSLTKGQLIGYVGTSGNAPANTPHLHFSIGVMNAERHWWQTSSLDPYLVYH